MSKSDYYKACAEWDDEVYGYAAKLVREGFTPDNAMTQAMELVERRRKELASQDKEALLNRLLKET